MPSFPLFPRGACLLSGLLLAAPSVAGAAAVLAVDFGRNDSLAAGVAGTSGTLLEPGFQGFYLNGAATFNGVAGLTYPGTDPILTSGSVTVNVQGDSSGAAGNVGGRNRGNPLDAGAFTYGDLLSDGIARTKLTSVQGEFTLQLLGLAPNTSFNMRLWTASSGSDIDTTYSWFDTTLGSTLLGTILNGPGFPFGRDGEYGLFGERDRDFQLEWDVDLRSGLQQCQPHLGVYQRIRAERRAGAFGNPAGRAGSRAGAHPAAAVKSAAGGRRRVLQDCRRARCSVGKGDALEKMVPV